MSSQVVTLYEDEAKTNALYPRTKLSAISDDDGKALSETISKLNNKTRINYLRPTLQTTTINGVTITNNGDGTYTLNGTATSTFNIGMLFDMKLSGQYKLIGCPEGGSEETYRLVLHNIPFSWATVDYGNGTVFNINETCNLQLYINAGVPLNNLVFKPMITDDLSATYDDFVSFDDSLVTGINSGLKMDLLWINVDQKQSFVAQTISLDLSQYKMVAIKTKAWGDDYNFNFCLVNSRSCLFSPVDDNKLSYAYRTITVSSNSIQIGEPNAQFENNYKDARYGIPMEIYGIK